MAKEKDKATPPDNVTMLPGAAIAVVIAAQHFGTGDALSSLPTSLPDENGSNWVASKENDGSVKLIKEASRHVYDSNRAMLSGAKERWATAHRQLNSATQHLAQNKDAVGDMPEKLKKNVGMFKKNLDDAQRQIDTCYSNCPALYREKLETESTLLVSKVKDLEKKAKKLRDSADGWRAKGTDFLPAEAIAVGASAEDRNEVRASQCDLEAERLEADIAGKQSQIDALKAEAEGYPGFTGEVQYTLKPGEVIGLTV